jgi:hypothetical protein
LDLNRPWLYNTSQATRAEEKVLTIEDFPESMRKGLNGAKGFILALPGLKMSGNSKLGNQSYLELLKYVREFVLNQILFCDYHSFLSMKPPSTFTNPFPVHCPCGHHLWCPICQGV